MLFNSFDYLLFLPVVALAYWLSPPKWRQLLLVLASYYFYMHAFKIYGLLLFGLTAFNYAFGLALSRATGAKRLLLIAGITFNLGMLALFKYTNLLLSSLNETLDHLGGWFPLMSLKSTGIHDLPIILPLGISFFVFEFIHYLTDVSKGSKPVKNPLRFALFASFFPSQIAGPIKRYQDFDKQLDKPAQANTEQIYSGLWLIAQGLFKKVALGDNLAPIAQAGFSAIPTLSVGDAWLAILAFAFQIYYDFSGYTDIGRGSAMLFGYSLPENFNMPYIALSLKEFWHRWHISLSTWLRDYLYIPLGGSRGVESRTLCNLFVTMLLGGLWHGASWTFLIWGAFHGAGLALNRIWEAFLKRNPALDKLTATLPGKVVSYLVTMVAVLCGWVFFYAKTLPDALTFIATMFGLRAGQGENMVSHLVTTSTLLPAAALYITLVACRFAARHKLADLQMPSPARLSLQTAALTIVLVLTMELAPRVLQPFIYFQF